MQLSSTLCRTQEARQRAVAAAATLANVRTIANAAAAAWAKEAHEADLREGRKARAADAHRSAEGCRDIFDVDRLSSENPDHGFANALSLEREPIT